jgi:hypothetical protein
MEKRLETMDSLEKSFANLEVRTIEAALLGGATLIIESGLYSTSHVLMKVYDKNGSLVSQCHGIRLLDTFNALNEKFDEDPESTLVSDHFSVTKEFKETGLDDYLKINAIGKIIIFCEKVLLFRFYQTSFRLTIKALKDVYEYESSSLVGVVEKACSYHKHKK